MKHITLVSKAAVDILGDIQTAIDDALAPIMEKLGKGDDGEGEGEGEGE